MNEIETYTLITTIAVCLLALAHIAFLVVCTVMLVRIKRIVTNIKATTDMGKDFLSSLREQQLKRAPLWKLGLFAFQKARSMKRK